MEHANYFLLLQNTLDPKTLCLFLTWELGIEKYISTPFRAFSYPSSVYLIETKVLKSCHNFVRHNCGGQPRDTILGCEARILILNLLK